MVGSSGWMTGLADHDGVGRVVIIILIMTAGSKEKDEKDNVEEKKADILQGSGH